MELTINGRRITFVTGDITNQPDADAIVNAANKYLKGGQGVCGAIFRAAGWDSLQRDCWQHKADGPQEVRCPTGEARMTEAFRLPNKAVIHAVGPIYNPSPLWDSQNEDELRSAYRNSLDLAAEHGFKTIAFPAISCGIYRYPLDEAACISVDECVKWLAETDASVEEIRFVFLPMADGPEIQAAFELAAAGYSDA